MTKTWSNECVICECPLDTGEGRICCECMREIEEKKDRQAVLAGAIQEAESGQFVIGGLT